MEMTSLEIWLSITIGFLIIIIAVEIALNSGKVKELNEQLKYLKQRVGEAEKDIRDVRKDSNIEVPTGEFYGDGNGNKYPHTRRIPVERAFRVLVQHLNIGFDYKPSESASIKFKSLDSE